jgi:hypothetical protein
MLHCARRHRHALPRADRRAVVAAREVPRAQSRAFS